MTKRTIQAIKDHTAKLYRGNELLIDYIMMEREDRMIVIVKNTNHRMMPTETISFNRINGKWDWGCRTSSFVSTYQQRKQEENIHRSICVYDRYELAD